MSLVGVAVSPAALLTAPAWTPGKLTSVAAWWDPALGVTLSASDVVSVADRAPGGTADTLTTTVGERPTFVASDGGFPAFAFSGTLQRFEVADSADLSPSGALSISMWIKRAAVGVTQALLAKWVTPTFPWWFYVDSGNNILVELNGSAQVGTYVLGTALTWKHIVVVYDGSLTGNANRLTMYENGVQKTLGFAGTIPATLADDSQPLSVGAQVGGANAFNGSMGPIVVVKRAITAAEITQLYNYERGSR